MALGQREKKELRDLASSIRLRQDTEILSRNRHNPFYAKGRIDLDKFIDFLNGYNEFANHIMRPFCRMADRNMKL